MRFDLDDEQRAIQETAAEICRRHAASDAHATGADPFWSELAATGWAGMAVPESLGGQGLGMVEVSLVVEELARVLAPATFMGNAAAAQLIAVAGSDDDRERLLPGIAAGERRAAIGCDRDGAADVLDAEGAALLVVAGEDSASVVEPVPHLEVRDGALDLSRRIARADISDARRLHGDAAAGAACVEVLIAADLVGVAQRAMELAVEHARQRQQFGRPIGAYQAVSHRCADMLVAVESARSAVLSAAWTADRDPQQLQFAASVAKVVAADAAWQATTSALQMHGGMGFTWEHPIHRYLRRAAVSARLFGTVDMHLERLATLGGLTESAAPS